MADECKKDENPPPKYVGGAAILPGPEDREKAAQEREKEKDREYKERHTSIQIGILITQIVLVFFGIIGSGISWYQSTTARQNAEQARRSADFAADSFEATYGEGGAAARTTEQMAYQTAAQFQSAQAAQNAVQLAQKQMRLDQRAWVVPYDVNPSTEAIVNSVSHKVSASVGFRNTGRTPAINGISFVSQTTDITHIPNRDPKPAKGIIPKFVLAPEAVGVTADLWFDNNSAAAINNSQRGVFIYGTFWYDDIFKNSHWTQYCFEAEVIGKIWHFIPCSVHNATDDTKYK